MNLTLQNRVTSILILASLLFISVFSFIQLNNQLANINRYNSYQANLSSAVVQNNFDAILQTLPQDQLSTALQKSIDELCAADVIKDIRVFDPEGTIIASAQQSLIGTTVSYRDIVSFLNLEKNVLEKKRFYVTTDQKTNSLSIYIALRIPSQEKIPYVGKLSFPLGNIQQALIAVYQPVILTIIFVIIFNILLGYFLSKTIIGPIKTLNAVTKQIAAGDLRVRIVIHTDDELQELGQTFNLMTEELIKMKERAENANPLTKLPGNIVIHEEIEKRISRAEKFVVIYCDLDNFKAFNDKYGIAKGDEAIILTAEVFKEAARTQGNTNDFVGHEGGDDFILVTTPDKANAVAEHINSAFDKNVRELYDQDDLTRGFIVSKTRDGQIKEFPIMTISLAGVTNATREITSYAQVTNIAAEVKKKAKAIVNGKSKYVLDQRTQ